MDTGMVVLVIMVILPVGGGAVFLLPSRHSRDGNTRHETFNANAESPSALTTDGSGTGGRSSPTARPKPEPGRPTPEPLAATAGTRLLEMTPQRVL